MLAMALGLYGINSIVEAKHRNAILGGGYGSPVNSELLAIAKRRQQFLRERGTNE